jgi:hypothetical protein
MGPRLRGNDAARLIGDSVFCLGLLTGDYRKAVASAPAPASLTIS